MLGGLARWLRALGYDTTWEAGIDDDELVRGAATEGRLVLTRDAALAARRAGESMLRVRADAPLDQLREVHARVPLSDRAAFTRCTRCNEPLTPVSPEQAAVPPAVRAAEKELRRCPSCHRVYWEGSHTARMRDAWTAALGKENGGTETL
jgi:hypothetical protein